MSRAKGQSRRGRSAAPREATISTPRDRDALLVSIILPFTTFSILCYEIILTRLFAYIFAYNLTALAVSFAVFGLGAGAYIRVRWLATLQQRKLAVVAHLGTGASLFVLYIVLMLTHQPVAITILSAMPFVFAGIAVSHYYEVRRSEKAAATYALDLTGAAIGCVASVILLVEIGGDRALLLLSIFAAASAMVASLRAESARRKLLRWATLCVVPPAAAEAFEDKLRDPLLNPHSSVSKQLPELLRSHGAVVGKEWSAVGRADLYETPSVPSKLIFSDGMNSSVFLPKEFKGSRGLFASLPYSIAPVGSTLILGAGAGLEVRVARDAGVRDIHAVELNDAIIKLVRKWNSFGGPIYDQPGVTLFVDEARKFVLTEARHYDLIQMSLVFTATAQSGTFALAHGYLYTEEAFESYLDHLVPTGMLAMIDDSYERTLKNTVTAVAALQRTRGLESHEAMKHIAVIHNPQREPGYKYMLFVSPLPLSDERIQRLMAEVHNRSLQAVWLPGLASTPLMGTLSNGGVDAIVSAAHVNVTPPTDDKPYLNFFAKTPQQIFRTFLPYIALSLLMATALAAMIVVDVRGFHWPDQYSTLLAGIYGIGFMFMELGLLHKLTLAVGGPTYVLSVLLFALLLSCGLGSLLSARIAKSFRARFGSFAIIVAIVGVLTAELIERWYRLDGVSSPVLRAACVIAMVTPIGLCLGAPFPDLLRRASRSDERRLAYLWAVNGVGSVLGGALTLILMPLLGANIVLLTGCVLYLLAWIIDRMESVPSAIHQVSNTSTEPR